MSDQPWVAPGSEPTRPVPPPPPPPPGAPSAAPPAAPPVAAPQGPPPGAWPPPPPAGPPPVPYRAVEFRPGIVPLRPLTLGDLYGGVLKAVRGNPAATIGLAALTSFVLLLPTTALGAFLAGVSGTDALGTAFSGSDTLPDGYALSLVGQYLPGIGQLLAGILLAGFLAQVVGQAVLGRKVGMGEVWRATRGRVLPMVGVVLVTGAAFLLLLVAAVLVCVVLVMAVDPQGGGGIAAVVLLVLLVVVVTVALLVLLWVRWSFATPAVVLERMGVFDSLSRSWELAGSPRRGPFWRIFGIRLLTAVIVGIASSMITFPISLALVAVVVASASGDVDPGTLAVAQTVVSGITALLTGALTTPFTAGVDALLYVDVRVRTEGLDIRLIQAAQGAAEPPWPVTSP